ncbi:unnamed protein product [Heterobilharzia americana]|nr:unnamed protein product [Heterobilharzia americana]
MSGSLCATKVTPLFSPLPRLPTGLFVHNNLKGLSTGILGPSILYLEILSGSREDETALIFTSRAVGCIGGWIVSCLLLDPEGSIKPNDLLSIGLFGLVVSNALIIFVAHLWWVLAVFFLQGLFATVSLQGCIYYHRYKKKWLHSIPQYLTVTFLLGCIFTPYLILFIEPTSNTIKSLGVRPSFIFHEIHYHHPNNHLVDNNQSKIHSIRIIENNKQKLINLFVFHGIFQILPLYYQIDQLYKH